MDLTLCERGKGTKAVLPMPSEFYEFTKRAYADYSGGTREQTANRSVLIAAMAAEGFAVNPNEWWHYDFKGWEEYAILDQPI